ncbi:hypothetical protein C7974DRAFT_415399 [Boeremia exigua]|uniref:uncharacterized protein n=1 Tax=Boeremia exigua TaxID=749465 RepID=UPI001E8D811A|nr:uncharacterized protein C7974DRAFT_415399 [Boeremia exigua]KAH6620170.1 hypothetical protein C7974DRAFT_415399 [Boeremia exigua]
MSTTTMSSRVPIHRLLRARTTRPFSLAPALPHTRCISTPTVLRPSFWASMIPKPLRKTTPDPSSTTPSTAPSRAWNPATPYIILSLLVGSQAIQILWLKQERAHSARRAEAQIGLLREVIERVQGGEDVDVEGVLGVGDAGREAAWREVVDGVAGEERLFVGKKGRRREREMERAREGGVDGMGDVAKEEVNQDGGHDAAKEEGIAKVESIGGVKFY